MKCPACGNTAATCVIGNYWQCPARGCINHTGVDKPPEWKFTNPADVLWLLPPGAKLTMAPYPGIRPTPFSGNGPTPSLTTLYSGSPWVPGQHKVATGCSLRHPGMEFEYSQGSLYDEFPAGKARYRAISGYADYVVELVRVTSKTRVWVCRVVHELP